MKEYQDTQALVRKKTPVCWDVSKETDVQVGHVLHHGPHLDTSNQSALGSSAFQHMQVIPCNVHAPLSQGVL